MHQTSQLLTKTFCFAIQKPQRSCVKLSFGVTTPLLHRIFALKKYTRAKKKSQLLTWICAIQKWRDSCHTKHRFFTTPFFGDLGMVNTANLGNTHRSNWHRHIARIEPYEMTADDERVVWMSGYVKGCQGSTYFACCLVILVTFCTCHRLSPHL